MYPSISGDVSGGEKHEGEDRREAILAFGVGLEGDALLSGDGEEGVLISTGEGEIVEANAAAERLLGRSREEIVSAESEEIFRGSGTPGAAGGRFRDRLRLVRGDGTAFDAEVGAVGLDDGKVGVVFQKAGARSSGRMLDEGFFEALVENRAGVVILFGEDGMVRYASPSVRKVLGHEPEEIIGSGLAERLHPDDRGRASGAFDVPGGRVSGPFRLLHGGGGWVEIEGSVENLLGDAKIDGIVLVGREAGREGGEGRPEGGFEEKLRSMVERLEESERRLGESERLFRTTFDEAPVGLAHVGVDGRWIRVNKKLCQILDYTRQELLGRTFQEVTHTDDLGPFDKAMRAVLNGEKETASVEKRYVKKDFTHVWVSVAASLVHGEAGRPRYFIFTVEDITGAKEARAISDSLSEREMEVLKLLGSGMTNRDIAARMNFSLSSAKVHVGRVISKLKATDRTNAAVKAASLGIL